LAGSGSKLVVMGDDAMEGEMDAEDDDEATVETDDGVGEDGDQAVTGKVNLNTFFFIHFLVHFHLSRLAFN